MAKALGVLVVVEENGEGVVHTSKPEEGRVDWV
jgi:hypothetical protein